MSERVDIVERWEGGIYYRSWLVDAPRGVVVLVHGLAEHCGRYDYVAGVLNGAGFSVCSVDLPGHGRSDGAAGDVVDFDVFEGVVLGLVEAVEGALSGVPMFILGHSMGGLIVSRFLLSHQDRFVGAVLSGAALLSPQAPPGWQVAVIRGMAKLFPGLGVLRLDASGVSRDPAVVADYRADPLVGKAKLSARFLVGLNGVMEEVRARVGEISLPIFLVHGSADLLASPEGSQLIFDRCGSGDKELKFYEGLFHEVFNEPERDVVLGDVVAWLDKRVAYRDVGMSR